MPIARVQLPDGRIARLDVPEGTTPQQVESFVLESHKGFKAPDALDQAAIDNAKPTALERFGRGFADIAQGVKQAGTYLGEKAASVALGEPEINPNSAGSEYTREKTAEAQAYERNRGEGVDWMRLAGNILGTAPLAAVGGGATSLGARSAVGAVQGATSTGLMFTPEDESRLQNMLVGAGFGATVPVVVQGLKSAAGVAGDKLAAFRSGFDLNNPALRQSLSQDLATALQSKGVDWNGLTQQVKDGLIQEAAGALKVGGKLDPEALARKATIEAVGGKPTVASVTRNPRAWQTEKNLRGVAGVGEQIVERDQQNAAALTDFLQRARAATGGKASTPLEAGRSVAGTLAKKAEETGDEVTALYNSARGAFGAQADLPKGNLAGKVIEVLNDYEDVIPGPIKKRLADFGLDRFDATNGARAFTVEEGDKLLKLINARYASADKATRAGLDGLRAALKESVLSMAEQGNKAAAGFGTAWKAASGRFAELREPTVANIIEGKVAPDDILKRYVLNGKADELSGLKRVLLKGTPEQVARGEQAFADLRGSVLDNLILKATGATNLDDVSGRAFSGRNFSKALDAIDPEKLHTLFSPDEIGQLRTLQKASKYLAEEVPFSDVNHSKTAAALANLMLKIGNTPLLGKIAHPVIGLYGAGSKWMEDANARKAVAEALLGGVPVDKQAASMGGRMLAPRQAGVIERVLPGAAGALYAEPSDSK